MGEYSNLCCNMASCWMVNYCWYFGRDFRLHLQGITVQLVLIIASPTQIELYTLENVPVSAHACDTWPKTWWQSQCDWEWNGACRAKYPARKVRGERGKLRIVTICMSPNSIKPMVIKSRNIRLARHETSTSNPASAHDTEHLKGKDH